MRDDISRLFEKLRQVDPPARLYHAILVMIEMKRRRTARILFSAGILTGITALAALLPASRYLYTSVTESGSLHYLSLLGSDSDIVLLYWRELAMNIIESLPAVALLSVFALCFVLLVGITVTASNARIAFMPRLA